MSIPSEHAGTHEVKAAPSGALASFLVCAFMLLSSLSIFSGDAVSDPVVVDNPDDTRTVVWDFDSPADYLMTGTELVGGDAVLEYLNLTDGDHDYEDYSAGTLTNVDIQSVPGSAIIGTGGPVETYVSELGPDVIDSYISENWPNDNYGDSSSIYLDSETGKMMRIVMQFDVSSIPSIAHITNATLWLYQQSGSRGDDIVCNVHSLSVPFAESEVSWTRNATASPWTNAGGDYDDHSYGTSTIPIRLGWYGVDLSDLVEAWTDGAVTNNGFILVPEPTVSDCQKVFQSSDDNEPIEHGPWLIVNYTVPANAGIMESRLIGPGTNSTFTSASYDISALSRLDDDFSGTATFPEWYWMNAPTDYDINSTTTGRLHVTGSPETEVQDTTVTCNYIYQSVTGDFSASTYLEDEFTEMTMGAGLLLYESSSDWMYVAKAQFAMNSRVQAVVCHSGTSALMSDIVWPEYYSAHLKMERNSTGVWFYASTDGESYQLVYSHASGTPLADALSVGLFVYSNSLTQPVVEFDHFTVAFSEMPSVEVKVRYGNSTLLSDPSWEDWESASTISSPAALGQTGRYLQYRASISSPEDWYTPVFSGFDCWYGMYRGSGVITTPEHVPTDFSYWIGMTTDETDDGGYVMYRYSTDGGDTWLPAGTGGSYSISSVEPSFMIRAEVYTYDTLRSPRVHSVSATHVTAVSYLEVVAPSQVVAGASFSVTITAKDGSDDTMVHWDGGLQLMAVDLDGTTPLHPDLAETEAWITDYGSVTILNERYTQAGTILIRVETEEGAFGLSGAIEVVPSTISSLHIEPTVDTLLEGAQQVFTGVARDAYGNTLTDVNYSWSVDEDIGSLNTYNGSTVIFTAGEAGNSGYLSVSVEGLTASLLITITHTANAPVFTEDPEDQSVYEDAGSWTIDLAPIVEDAVHQDYELRWYATGENVIDVSGENRTGNLVMTLSTLPDISGTDVLNVVVVDPDGLWSSTSFSVEVEAVNDWPVISLIDPLVVHYGVLYIYNLRYYIEDVDNTQDELSMWVDDENAPYVAVQDLALHITYPAEMNGMTQTVIVTVSDGEAGTSTVIQVTVSDNNVPVTADTIPGVDIYQGEALLDVFDLDDYFTDPDGDDLSFAYWYSHVLVNVSTDHEVSFFAPTDWWGSEYVIFSATDEYGARVESAATVLVHRVNQAPVISGVPDLVVRYDLEYRFDLTWYVSDPDNDVDDLHVTTNDPNAVPSGMMLSLEYPYSMTGTSVFVTITVSDGELHDNDTIKVTIGENTPPTATALPLHSFQEDQPVPYPSTGGLEAYFGDEDGEQLTFEAFSLTDGVSASASADSQDEWSVVFTTTANWNGYAWFVVRGTDPGGAIVETVAELRVFSVPDAPVISFNETIEVYTGVQRAVDLYEWASDPDLHAQGLEFTVSSTYAAYATVIEGVLVLEFPHEFLDGGEEQRSIGISISVSDPDGLHGTDTLSVVVVGTLEPGNGEWVIVGMAAMAAVAIGSFVVAMRLRKRPFVIKDIMVIHNDGFLIGRAAAKTEGEIDEDVLSGMLTAVLNFVEDSMAKTQDGLRSFGFKHYKALVKRGNMTYMAVVYEGDAPEAVEDRLAEFLAKVEKIYRKRIENWTGDMDTDFAGIEVLLKAFVKENSRKANGLNGKGKAA